MLIKSNRNSMWLTSTTLANHIAVIPSILPLWQIYPMPMRVPTPLCSISTARGFRSREIFSSNHRLSCLPPLSGFWRYMRTANIVPFPMPSNSWTVPTHRYFRYLLPTMSLPTTFLPLWMLGREERRNSYRDRLRVPRYRFHAWFLLPSIGWWQVMISRLTSTIPTSRKYLLWAIIPTARISTRQHSDFTIAVS